MSQRHVRMLLSGSILISIQVAAYSQSTPSAAAQQRTDSAPSGTGNSAGAGSAANAGEQEQTESLTLADAEARALKNQPRLLAAGLRTDAARKRITESRSAYFPQASANLTAVESNGDTAVAAGALTTSSVSTRAAAGGSLVQMITDFGHTSNLVQASRFSAQAAGESEETARQIVLRDVQEAYFAAEAAESIRKTAQAVLDFRRVTLRQLSALAQSQLRSTLDVQFAQVMVSEAELAVVRAQSNVERAQAQLAASMGEENSRDYTFVDQPPPATPDTDFGSYIRAAIENRPDLKALELHQQSAAHEALAERDLNFPSVSALASGGEVPVRDASLHHDWGAVGFNINVPIFNGGLYSARAAEAKLEAKAAAQEATLRQVEVVRDVRMAWADARDAYLQIDVTQRLVEQTNQAMRLAQARYDAGLGSIVELNQAELNQTSALITAASARFDYLRSMTAFHFAMGDLH